MLKKLSLTLLGIVLVLGTIGFIFYGMVRTMIAAGANQGIPPSPVTAAPVLQADWQPTITSVATLTAVQGVTISAQLDGSVAKIAFEAGQKVKAGDLLVQEDVSTEQAQISAAKAAQELARINLQRSRQLLANNTIARSQYDADNAAFLQAQAQVAQIQATIDKKTIRAPFGGRLGVRLINLGQTIKAGDPIVSLQNLTPIYADFYLPQQDLSDLATGLKVQVRCDALPDKIVGGTLTAIDPDVDAATRNIQVEATLANPDEKLRPGMFVDLDVVLPRVDHVLVIPETAIEYAPYGDSVFVVEDHKDDKTGKTSKIVVSHTVRLGRTRGDYVEVVSGLHSGDVVVTSGAFKLRTGMPVFVDNTLAPKAEMNPQPADS
jgi:membrane fusion protein (multidrug efflux system)